MEKNKAIGITLLFALPHKASYTAYLKSYVLEISTWKDISVQIRQIRKRNSNLLYLGIEDVFHVSGPFNEKEVLGKSYIDSLVTVKESRSLVKKKNFTCQLQSSEDNKEKWFLVSLIYFYNDQKINDTLTIPCFTPILAKNVTQVKSKIKVFCENQSFLKKIVVYRIDKMKSKNLNYIGIEDIILIEEDAFNGGAFETTFKRFKSLDKIKELLPKKMVLKKSFDLSFS